jgi:hypothetical protein
MFTKIKLVLVSFKILLTQRIKKTCVISSVNALVIFLIIVFYRSNHAKKIYMYKIQVFQIITTGSLYVYDEYTR